MTSPLDNQKESLDELPHLVWLDHGDQTLEFNLGWKKFFGDSFNAQFSTLIHHSDYHQVLNDRPWEANLRLRRQDGAWVWHRLILSKYKNGWMGTAVNIHEFKQVEESQKLLAEAVLHLSQESSMETRLRSVAKLIVRRFGGWCTLQFNDGTVVSESSAFLSPKIANQIFELAQTPGSSPIRTDGSVLMSFSHLNPSPWAKLGLNSCLSSLIKKDETVFGVITIISTEETLGESDLLFAGELNRLITPFIENSRLVDELRQREDHLREAVASRDIFLSICSHELKTPIQSLKLISQITMRKILRGTFHATEENVVSSFQRFSSQVDRLAILVEDMLDISRMESGNFIFRRDYFNLSGLLNDVVEKYLVHFEELKIPLTYDLDQDVSVNGDVVRIEQVIQNIINNAIKYGRLSPVHITLKKEETSAVIGIKDNGEGIPENFLEKIFLRFERVNQDSKVTGLGLGLYICKSIVDSHQGVIRVNSTVGVGSTFFVYLPLKQ